MILPLNIQKDFLQELRYNYFGMNKQYKDQ